MEDSLKIRGLTILEGGLKLNLLRSLHRCFIQSVTQSLYHALDANLTTRGKYHFQQNFAFYFKATSFFSVNRPGLECDLGRNRFRHCFRSLSSGRGTDY